MTTIVVRVSGGDDELKAMHQARLGDRFDRTVVFLETISGRAQRLEDGSVFGSREYAVTFTVSGESARRQLVRVE